VRQINKKEKKGKVAVFYIIKTQRIPEISGIRCNAMLVA